MADIFSQFSDDLTFLVVTYHQSHDVFFDITFNKFTSMGPFYPVMGLFTPVAHPRSGSLGVVCTGSAVSPIIIAHLSYAGFFNYLSFSNSIHWLHCNSGGSEIVIVLFCSTLCTVQKSTLRSYMRQHFECSVSICILHNITLCCITCALYHL